MTPALAAAQAPPRLSDARGLAAPRLVPLPACSHPGRLEVRWEAPAGTRGAGDRRYEVRLLDLRTREVLAAGSTRGTGWTTPPLPSGGVFEMRVRARETRADGATASSAWTERRFRTGFCR